MILKCLKSTYWTDRDELVGVIHHGDEKIEQDNYVDDGKTSKHDEAPKSRELEMDIKKNCMLVYCYLFDSS